jgi:hypothetical protein
MHLERTLVPDALLFCSRLAAVVQHITCHLQASCVQGGPARFCSGHLLTRSGCSGCVVCGHVALLLTEAVGAASTRW